MWYSVKEQHDLRRTVLDAMKKASLLSALTLSGLLAFGTPTHAQSRLGGGLSVTTPRSGSALNPGHQSQGITRFSIQGINSSMIKVTTAVKVKSNNVDHSQLRTGSRKEIKSASRSAEKFDRKTTTIVNPEIRQSGRIKIKHRNADRIGEQIKVTATDESGKKTVIRLKVKPEKEQRVVDMKGKKLVLDGKAVESIFLRERINFNNITLTAPWKGHGKNGRVGVGGIAAVPGKAMVSITNKQTNETVTVQANKRGDFKASIKAGEDQNLRVEVFTTKRDGAKMASYAFTATTPTVTSNGKFMPDTPLAKVKRSNGNMMSIYSASINPRHDFEN